MNHDFQRRGEVRKGWESEGGTESKGKEGRKRKNEMGQDGMEKWQKSFPFPLTSQKYASKWIGDYKLSQGMMRTHAYISAMRWTGVSSQVYSRLMK